MEESTTKNYTNEEKKIYIQKEESGFAVSSLVLGIIGLVFSWIPFLNIFTNIGSVLSIIFGAVGLNKKQNKGMCIAGIICGIIAIIIMILMFIMIAVSANNDFNSVNSTY